MDAQEYIEGHLKGHRNQMVPIVLEYGWIVPDTLAYELARDEAGRRYGVTVIGGEPPRIQKDLSDLFPRQQDAHNHIAQLQAEMNPPPDEMH